MGAVKAVRAASKPRGAKKAAKRATRRTKAEKPKRVTKKSQAGSKLKVWNGSALYTKGGLMKADLMKSSRGRIVSKKMNKKGQALKKGGGWMAALNKARKELGITGFCTINRGAQGVALYKKAKELYKH